MNKTVLILIALLGVSLVGGCSQQEAAPDANQQQCRGADR